MPLPGKTFWRETNRPRRTGRGRSLCRAISRASGTPSPPASRCCAVRTCPPADDVGGPGHRAGNEIVEEAGLSRLLALETATVNPAKLMGAADRISQVQHGFFADLIAVDDNPLDDLATLGTVRIVLQEGRPVKLAS